MHTEKKNPASRESLLVYKPAPILREEHEEDSFTRIVEQQTARVPSSIFLVASFVSMLLTVFLEISGHQRWSRFIGMWVAPLLLMGVYNKLVKIFGPR
jgi:hypothetical protein